MSALRWALPLFTISEMNREGKLKINKMSAIFFHNYVIKKKRRRKVGTWMVEIAYVAITPLGLNFN